MYASQATIDSRHSNRSGPNTEEARVVEPRLFVLSIGNRLTSNVQEKWLRNT